MHEITLNVTREQLNQVTTTINLQGQVTNIRLTQERGDVIVEYDKDESPYKFVVSPNGFRTKNVEGYRKRRGK